MNANGAIEDAAECRRRVEQLSPQLREVLRLMAEGQCTKEIAERMGVAQSTAAVYRERVYSRLAVNNVALATRVAVAAGVV